MTTLDKWGRDVLAPGPVAPRGYSRRARHHSQLADGVFLAQSGFLGAPTKEETMGDVVTFTITPENLAAIIREQSGGHLDDEERSRLVDVISSMTAEELAAATKLQIVIRVGGRMRASIDLTSEMKLFDVGVSPDSAELDSGQRDAAPGGGPVDSGEEWGDA